MIITKGLGGSQLVTTGYGYSLPVAAAVGLGHHKKIDYTYEIRRARQLKLRKLRKEDDMILSAIFNFVCGGDKSIIDLQERK